ncbi:MAG: lysophospholipid acyltransferase family protein [Candidatus Omnitrophica bacterium]|nr:lysophospholipid acyltransferase family protein [Candidatus Omnitrophota bacterium]MDD5487601.1 lysophospholipid acyltransferase family protein [Candidatus Omnitrophota bacterium]
MKIKYRRYYIYYLAKTLFFLLALLPLRAGMALAAALGRLVFRLLPGYAKTTVANLDAAFPGNGDRNRKIAENVFRNVAMNGVEWVKLLFSRVSVIDSMVTEVSGREHLDSVLAGGRGALIITFHFGNWELAGLYLAHIGYNGSLVARKVYFYKYNKFLEKMRARYNAKVIYRDESPKKMLGALHRGEVVGIVPDQDVDSVNGVFVDYFGRKAYTPVAPVKIAMAVGTGIVPVFVIRKKDNTHRVVIEEPIYPVKGDDVDGNIRRYTEEWTSLLERYVREYPEQWVWMHKRWKTRPEEE